MDAPDVDEPSATVSAMAEPWPLIEALVGGTFAMRRATETFLPKFPAEEQASYNERLQTATLFPAFFRTAVVLAAKPFSRQIDVQGTVPEPVRALFQNVDHEGTHLQPFCAALMQRIMQFGLSGVLVDVPRADGVVTIADEKSAGVRPYFTVYPAQSILGWRSERTPEGDKLTLLRLLEEVEEPDGEWLTKIVKQVRVLRPGSWEIWRKVRIANKSGETWTLYQSGLTSIQRIPFVFFYGLRVAFGVGAPPLLELAHLNVEHFQSSSDQRTILHVARVPILFAKGFAESDKIVVGAAKACRSNGEDADLKYVEHTGAAIKAGRQSITDLEDKMRQVGAELLVQQPSTTTATQITAESEGNRSILQQIAESFERSLEACIVLLAEWQNLKAEPIVKLFKNYGSANMSEKSGQLLLQAAGEDHVSSETVFDALKRTDVLPQELTWDDEKLRLAAQPRGAPPGRGDKTPAA